MIKKRMLVMWIISLLIMATVPVHAANSAVEKDEVVYTTLQPNGSQQEMYIVNSFKVENTEEIVDYGNYTTVKNLTDLSEIVKEDEKVSFSTSEDTFYYQGDLEGKLLPWKFDISYQLNGNNISAEDLAGQDGHLKIEIQTSANEQVNPIFYNNYLLQISLTLDAGKYQEIVTENGTIANAGKNKQVTYTVMPEQEETLVLEADVTDLELNAIEISGVPSALSIESPDVDQITGDFESLTDATKKIDDAVGDLKTGIADLNNGMADLTSGSADYKNGIAELNNSSTELLNGSAAIDKALVTMKDSLNQDMSGADFGKLRVGLIKISEGMKEAATGLTTLRDNYTKAYQKLDESIHAIPAHEISEEEIKRIASKLEEEQDRKIVQKLAETYGAAQKAKGTYEATKEVFAAVDPTLNEISGAQTEMATSLETMASEVAKASEKINIQESIKELQNGLGKLSDNYKSFHGGLVEYTHGVRELSNAYQSIHQGVTDIYHGTTELENGTTELRNGTSKLADSTSELPEQMQEEIDKMINEFDKSDFDAESFVSEKNENIQSVQFVIKTEAIEKEEQAEEQQETAKEKSFWDKLLDLFR